MKETAPVTTANPKAVREHAPPVRKKRKPPSVWKELLYLLLKIAGIGLCFVLLFTFLFGLHRNSDASMAPAIREGDLVMFYRLDTHYVARDALLLEFEGKRQVRRVVATAGDTVDVTESGLMINGALQQEPEIYQKTHRYAQGVEFPLTVGEGQVFVLADARQDATDSRIYGVVEVKDTMGKVMAILRRRNI